MPHARGRGQGRRHPPPTGNASTQALEGTPALELRPQGGGSLGCFLLEVLLHERTQVAEKVRIVGCRWPLSAQSLDKKQADGRILDGTGDGTEEP